MSSRTILGPLTTRFTPSPSCTVPVLACSTCDYGWGAQTCFSGGVEDFTGCWPATGTSANLPAQTQPLWGWGFYSPGLICPQGYTSACSATATETTGTWKPQWVMSAGETAVGCCPSNYACTSNHPGINTCAYVATSTGVPVSTCTSGKAAPVSTVIVPFLAGGTEQNNFTIYAPLIQIVYQSTDVVSTTTSTGTKTKMTVSSTSNGRSSNSTSITSSSASKTQPSSFSGTMTTPSRTQISQTSSSTSSGPSSTQSKSNSGASSGAGAKFKTFLVLGGMAALAILLG